MTRKEKLRHKGVLIDESCPKCKGRMIGNQVGEKWCSQCSHGLLDFNVITHAQENERVLSQS